MDRNVFAQWFLDNIVSEHGQLKLLPDSLVETADGEILQLSDFLSPSEEYYQMMLTDPPFYMLNQAPPCREKPWTRLPFGVVQAAIEESNHLILEKAWVDNLAPITFDMNKCAPFPGLPGGPWVPAGDGVTLRISSQGTIDNCDSTYNKVNVCECGSEKAKSIGHSSWCPKFER